MKNYIIAIDEGTTSTKAMLFNITKNKIVDMVKREFHQYYPHEAWVEHNAEEIYLLTRSNLSTLLLRNGLTAKDILSIGITNQRETVVAWNKKTGKPLTSAIVWQCKRTAEYCKSLDKKTKDFIKEKTGLIMDSYFSASKIKWLLNNNENVKNELKNNNLCIGTIDSFLVYRLTNKKVFATDSTNASRTMLTSLASPLSWDDELLKIFNIKKSILPEIKNSADDYGSVRVKSGSIDIASVIGDQQSSLIGQGATDEGDAKITYGTGAFILQNIGEKPKNNNKLLTTVACTINGKTTYALEGSIFNVGSTLNFLKNNLKLFTSFNKLEKELTGTTSDDDTIFVPAFSGLGAPHWKPEARGTLFNMTLNTTKLDIIKSAYRSFAYMVNDIFDKMDKKSIKGIISVDGGVSKSEYLLNYQSDILGVPIARASSEESTALGAIYLAGMQKGAYRSLNEIKSLIKHREIIYPQMDEKTRKDNIKRWNNYLLKV